MAFDQNILFWIQEHLVHPVATPVMAFFSAVGDAGFVWLVLAVCLLCSRRYRRFGYGALLALVLAFVVGNVFLKNVVARVRPCDVFSWVELLIPRPHDLSFPSGHTFSSFAAAGVLFGANRKWGIAALLLAACIAFSRLYFFVHFPTDVLAGLLLGLGTAWAVVWAVRRYIPEPAKKKRL